MSIGLFDSDCRAEDSHEFDAIVLRSWIEVTRSFEIKLTSTYQQVVRVVKACLARHFAMQAFVIRMIVVKFEKRKKVTIPCDAKQIPVKKSDLCVVDHHAK